MARLKLSKFSLVLILVILAAAGGALAYIRGLEHSSQLAASLPLSAAGPAPARSSPTPAVTQAVTPAVFALKVPFTPQAPTANWDQLHNEACEEAVAIMANAYFSGNNAATLPPDYVEQQLGALTVWEQQNLGRNLDTTSAETARMISAVYGLKTEVIKDFAAADLQRELLAGHLVLISEDGRLLGNPNYRQPGPVHHMLLLRGYTPEGFVTNDSGTRKGENYFYTFDAIKNAAADWNTAANTVDQTQKLAIIVSAPDRP